MNDRNHVSHTTPNAAQVVATCLIMAAAAVASGALFPPGDISKQLTIVLVWIVVGWVLRGVWQ